MALFGGDKADVAVLLAEKGALLVKVEMLEKYIDEKKEEITRLTEQLRWTQDALVAKEAPEAYRDRMDAEAAANRPEMTEEEKAQRKLYQEKIDITSRYINEIEGQMFIDRDDMIQQLTRGVGSPTANTQSLHGNDES
jgi:hypothetical protein